MRNKTNEQRTKENKEAFWVMVAVIIVITAIEVYFKA